MAQIMNQKRGRGSSGVGEASGSNTQTSSANQLSRLPTPGTLTDELAALFECPVCFEIVLPPIMQCQVGHLVCSSCRPKLSCCPTCRGTLVSSVTHSTREEMDCRYTKDIAELHKENDRLEQSVDDLPQETLNRPSANILPFIREKLIPVGGFTEADACKIQWAQDVMRDYEIRVKGMTDEAEAEVVANLTGRQKFCMNPSDIRNLAMEKVANNLMFPCKHKQTGCRMSLGLNEKAEHEEVCEFRPYSCPCPGASCSWQGQLEKVMVHLQHAHQNITTLNGEDIVFLATEINLPGAVDWVMMQSCFGHHFMLILEKQEKCDGHTQFFAIVQLIGSRKQAEHFAYRLELNGNRRRLTWEAMPRSSHEGVASAIMGSDCLVFDTSIAQLFADNGNLGINVTISVVC